MPGHHNAYSDLYDLVATIPRGAVSSYGRLAAMTPVPSGARGVGWALSALPDDRDDVPWWRVVSASGAITNVANEEEQRRRLEADGVAFKADGRVELHAHLWDGRSAPRLNASRSGRLR